MNSSDIPPHLHWACRRGMLELDVLLGNFLREAYLALSDQDKASFVALLACNDQQLFNWLTNKSQSEEAHLQKIIEKVQAHARHRHQTF